MPATFYTHLEGTNVKLEYDKDTRTLTLHGASLADVNGTGSVYVEQFHGRTFEIALLTEDG